MTGDELWLSRISTSQFTSRRRIFHGPFHPLSATTEAQTRNGLTTTNRFTIMALWQSGYLGNGANVNPITQFPRSSICQRVVTSEVQTQQRLPIPSTNLILLDHRTVRTTRLKTVEYESAGQSSRGPIHLTTPLTFRDVRLGMPAREYFVLPIIRVSTLAPRSRHS